MPGLTAVGLKKIGIALFFFVVPIEMQGQFV
jgi:hypothetical protein